MDAVMKHLHRMALAFFTLVLCLGALTACGMAKPMPPFDSFAHRISDSTVALYWNCSRPAAGIVRVDGWANNPYSPGPIKGLEFILYGVNAQGGTVSQVKGSAQSYLIQTNEPSQFAIDLKTVGGEARYDLVYEYYGSADGGGGRFGMAGGGNQRQQNMARDVCQGMRP